MRSVFFPGLLIVMLMLVANPSARGQGDSDSPETGQVSSFAEVFFVAFNTDPVTGESSVDLIGSLIIWFLMLLSAVNLGLIGHLAMTTKRDLLLPGRAVEDVKRLMREGDFRRVLDLTGQDQSFFGALMHAGLAEASHGLAAVQRTLESAADVLIADRMKPIDILYMFGQVSPMVGLLGTVYGIIHAFLAFVSAGGHASPSVLAGGIGTALVATFWGLLVAIPALGAYAFFRSKVDVLTLEAINAADEIVNQLRPRATATTAPAVKATQAAAAT